jgi:hypothetical protein
LTFNEFANVADGLTNQFVSGTSNSGRTFPSLRRSVRIAQHQIKTPKIIAGLERDARVGVLLDGPKEEEQMILAEQLLREYRSVAFVALDDIGPIFDVEHRGELFRASPYATFSTSDREFFDRYGWLNQDRLPPRMLGDAGHTGYGMGILINHRP